MTSLLVTHANTVLLGIVVGAGYYFLARAMEVASLRVTGRRQIGAIVGAFVVRVVIAGAGMLAVIAFAGLNARALCLGVLTGYTIVLGGEAVRHFRRAVRASEAGAHRREAAHGR